MRQSLCCADGRKVDFVTDHADAKQAETALPEARYFAASRWLFIVTILTGSFLLFLIQPMVARMALPELGGSPSVWNSAMLVYQSLLLAGYYYAHRLSRLAPRKQAFIHIALFASAALWLPIGLIVNAPPAGISATLWVPWMLLASIGPVFLVVAAQAPIVQRWYVLAGNKGEPYALYAASNLGSFGGLIAYPMLVEPFVGTVGQSLMWSALYGLLAALMAICALIAAYPRTAAYPPPPARERPSVSEMQVDPSAPDERPGGAAPTWRDKAMWIALAAVPSGLMLSTTTIITTDIVATPLIWVIPLGLYLLSFTVAFANWQEPADAIRRAAPYALIAIMTANGVLRQPGDLAAVLLNLLLMGIVAVALHNEMYRRRPDPSHLTEFYLMMSVGGALGGLFCAIVAPLIFDWVYEHPLLIVAAALLMMQRYSRVWRDFTPVAPSIIRPVQLVGAVVAIIIVAIYGLIDGSDSWRYWRGAILALIGILAIGNRPIFALVIMALWLVAAGFPTVKASLAGEHDRSYFGVYSVRDLADSRVLIHGTTMHGVQNLDPATALQPTSYYGRQSGVGRALLGTGNDARIGIVGLGIGTLTCYRRAGQDWTLFEIDPEVVTIARDTDRFTFLSRCAPDASIRIGDARITLASGPDDRYDLLAIDAFSSDAIPMHLLTREAFRDYADALANDGLLIVHISNRFIDLKPVLAAEAAAAGWSAALLLNKPDDDAGNVTVSEWVAMSKDKARLLSLTGPLPDGAGANAEGWRRLTAAKPVRWTDNFSSVLPLIKGWN